MIVKICLATFILTTVSFSIDAQIDKAILTVEGEVTKPLKLTVDDLSKMNETEVKAKDRDGKEHVYKGVKLVDVLTSAGVTLGGQLRGENLTKVVLVKAVDGYEVVYALPEIDPEFTNQTIYLVYRVDGNPLPAGEGPFRMIVPNEKKHARWIREIAAIKVLFVKE